MSTQGQVRPPKSIKGSDIVVSGPFSSTYKKKDKETGKTSEVKAKQYQAFVGYKNNKTKIAVRTGIIPLDVHGPPSNDYCVQYLEGILQYIDIPLDVDTPQGKLLFDTCTEIEKFFNSPEVKKMLFEKSTIPTDEIDKAYFKELIRYKEAKKEEHKDKKFCKVPYVRAYFTYDGNNKTLFTIRNEKIKNKKDPNYRVDFDIASETESMNLNEIVHYNTKTQYVLTFPRMHTPLSINKKKGEIREYALSVKVEKMEIINDGSDTSNNNSYRNYNFDEDSDNEDTNNDITIVTDTDQGQTNDGNDASDASDGDGNNNDGNDGDDTPNDDGNEGSDNGEGTGEEGIDDNDNDDNDDDLNEDIVEDVDDSSSEEAKTPSPVISKNTRGQKTAATSTTAATTTSKAATKMETTKPSTATTATNKSEPKPKTTSTSRTRKA